jgi:hypothetical protein
MLKKLFQSKYSKYELLPPPYMEEDENLPAYEDIEEQDNKCDKQKHSRVVNSINMITSGKVDYIMLDNTTVKPMEIMDYFIDNGEASHKDVFVLFVKSSPETDEQVFFNGIPQVTNHMFNPFSAYYLISRNVKLTIKSWRTGLVKTSDKSVSIVNIILGHNSSIYHTNFVAIYNRDLKKSLNNISKKFNESFEKQKTKM